MIPTLRHCCASMTLPSIQSQIWDAQFNRENVWLMLSLLVVQSSRCGVCHLLKEVIQWLTSKKQVTKDRSVRADWIYNLIETMLGNLHYFYMTVHCYTSILIEQIFPYFELYSILTALFHTCSCMVCNEVTPGLVSVHGSGISLLL